MGGALEAVWQRITREQLIGLTLVLSAIPSVTSEEQAMVEFVQPAAEHQSVEDLYNCTRVYAALALDLCTKTRDEARLRLRSLAAARGS